LDKLRKKGESIHDRAVIEGLLTTRDTGDTGKAKDRCLCVLCAVGGFRDNVTAYKGKSG
jgi:hypothetical protein